MINRKKGIRVPLFGLVVACIIAVPMMGFSSPASAAKTKLSPNTMVSNDGKVTTPTAPSSNEFTNHWDGASTSSYKGTGKMVSNKTTSIVTKKTTVKNDLPFIGVKSIIGTDSRVRVTPASSYPYRAIAHISSDIGGCTGWFINQNTIVTAGHCVYNTSTNKWATWATITPGKDGSSAPYGTASAVSFHSVVGWVTNEDTNYDYGAIKINSNIGSTTGWFGLLWQSASLTGTAETISGYPGDKPYGTQWRHSDQIRQTYARKLHYANDTYGGQSGSPVYKSDYHSIAIHTNGVYGGNPYNRGTRITEDVFNNLLYWRDL
ncbi:trypsin-like serine peptidase [Marininema halotolerans]|uniref:Serine protease n=1 Tax=Marininema halotolerans TaxID=1155944 RepID=A0A1I6P5U7_9BACL|nr:serine protease [Marininema halotolerans]SFS35450.1 glutamyl endopeptidase [Marininema halotolerans]